MQSGRLNKSRKSCLIDNSISGCPRGRGFSTKVHRVKLADRENVFARVIAIDLAQYLTSLWAVCQLRSGLTHVTNKVEAARTNDMNHRLASSDCATRKCRLAGNHKKNYYSCVLCKLDVISHYKSVARKNVKRRSIKGSLCETINFPKIIYILLIVQRYKFHSVLRTHIYVYNIHLNKISKLLEYFQKVSAIYWFIRAIECFERDLTNGTSAEDLSKQHNALASISHVWHEDAIVRGLPLSRACTRALCLRAHSAGRGSVAPAVAFAAPRQLICITKQSSPL